MPANGTSTTYKFLANTANNRIAKSGAATITAGKYYQTTLAARYPLAMASATTDDLGALLASDGNIYETGAAATAASTTAIGVIAYIGTDNFTENVSGYMNTKTLAEKTDAATNYPAAYQAKNYTGLTAPAAA